MRFATKYPKRADELCTKYMARNAPTIRRKVTDKMVMAHLVSAAEKEDYMHSPEVDEYLASAAFAVDHTIE